jgi:hypothetical protein
MKKAWAVAADEVQLSTLKAALEAARGNITRASQAVGVTRQHATRLMQRYALVGYAAALRLQCGATRVAGGPRHGTVTGRPRKA